MHLWKKGEFNTNHNIIGEGNGLHEMSNRQQIMSALLQKKLYVFYVSVYFLLLFLLMIKYYDTFSSHYRLLI